MTNLKKKIHVVSPEPVEMSCSVPRPRDHLAEFARL